MYAIRSYYGIGVKNSISATKQDISEASFVADINKSIKAINDNLNIEPKYMMYKNGLVSDNLRKAVNKIGFKAALGQHSGAFYNGSDKYVITSYSIHYTKLYEVQ